MRLKGKVALITGGARGIGRASAELFAREGAKVHVADLDFPLPFESAVIVTHKLDVTDERNWKSVVDEVIAADGRIDILFNNAGTVKSYVELNGVVVVRMQACTWLQFKFSNIFEVRAHALLPNRLFREHKISEAGAFMLNCWLYLSVTNIHLITPSVVTGLAAEFFTTSMRALQLSIFFALHRRSCVVCSYPSVLKLAISRHRPQGAMK